VVYVNCACTAAGTVKRSEPKRMINGLFIVI
jgi:hypothetical protein